jgi:hypothetical protein
MAKRKKDSVREDRIHNEAIVDAYGPEGAGPALVLLPGEQNALPVPGQVHRGQGGFATPQR